MVRIVEKVKDAIAKGQTVFSFEFFPPRTEEGVEHLFERMERMVAFGPVFCDITWGAGGSTADVTLDIATRMQNVMCVETMMHLTCTNMPVEKIDSALTEVRAAGLQNILALRGDPPKGQEKFEAVEGGFSCALDLVRHIRATHGDYFGICVAGYSEAHPDTIVEDPVQMDKNYWENMAYLKEKVDAGGDMVITQLFYDVDQFLKFVGDCKTIGITAPIIPGIMPIMTYGGFKRMTGFCKTRVPPAVMEIVEANKDNEEAIKNYGIEMGAEMCRRLLDAGVPGIHLYSLNLEKSVLAILQRMGIIDTSSVPRPLPWELIPMGTRRAVEAVRPIFWQHRPKAYLLRTQGWATFPTNRWAGTIAAQPLGALPAKALQRHTHSEAAKAKALEAWGAALEGVADVQRVFERFYRGEITLLPWYESAHAQPPAAPLQEGLAGLAGSGILVINAQPAVNGAPSADTNLGWGNKGGYVYARAYLEAFVSPETWQTLLPKLKAADNIQFIATNSAGELTIDLLPDAVSAVTWGVFPGKEVVQPHVVDVDSFAVWSEEAFSLWSAEWGACYEEGSPSRTVLQDIAATWYLVSIVHNDHHSGNLLSLFA